MVAYLVYTEAINPHLPEKKRSRDVYATLNIILDDEPSVGAFPLQSGSFSAVNSEYTSVANARDGTVVARSA